MDNMHSFCSKLPFLETKLSELMSRIRLLRRYDLKIIKKINSFELNPTYSWGKPTLENHVWHIQ